MLLAFSVPLADYLMNPITFVTFGFFEGKKEAMLIGYRSVSTTAVAIIAMLVGTIPVPAYSFDISLQAPEGLTRFCDGNLRVLTDVGEIAPIARSPNISLNASGFREGRGYGLELLKYERLRDGTFHWDSVDRKTLSYGRERQPRSDMKLNDLDVGEYRALLKESGKIRTLVAASPQYVVAERRFAISTPNPSIKMKTRFMAGEKIEVQIGPIIPIYLRRDIVSVVLTPQYSDSKISDKDRQRSKNVSICLDQNVEFRGLPAGNYELRIVDAGYDIIRKPFVVERNDLSFWENLGQMLSFGTESQPAMSTPASRAIACDLLSAYENDLPAIEEVAEHADHAILAWAAYGDDVALQMAADRGWAREEIFTREHWFSGDTYATLFKNINGDRVLSFRGTDGLPDWFTNTLGIVAGDLGDNQVEDASEIAKAVADTYGHVTLVGHSLGGRMAQVARLETDNPAVVFNSSPLAGHEVPAALGASALGIDSDLIGFRGPEDPFTSISPGSYFRDKKVDNIANTSTKLAGEALINADYTHSMAVLARAMYDVQTAKAAGWIDDAICKPQTF